MVVFIENWYSDSAVCISLGANTFVKGMHPPILTLAMGKIVGKTGLFNLDMATGLGEGKLWIQTC